MPKYNLYKINKKKENNLIEKLKSTYVGLKNTYFEEVEGYNLKFFFSSQPEPVRVWWIELYKDFIGNKDDLSNIMYFGVLLITNNSCCYAVSFGKAHFYLREYCDTDFGLNLAERIANENSITTKTSKHHKSKKSKSIDTFLEGSDLDYDGGESIHYLKAKTINPKKWGKACYFGSSVQFSLEQTPLELPKLIDAIENKLLEPAIISIPRTKKVEDCQKNEELDRKLYEAILAKKSNIQVDEFSLYGVNFIFVGEQSYSFFSNKNNSSSEVQGELDMNRLRLFWKKNQLDDTINETKVKITSEQSKTFSKTLKHFLDYTDENNYCLVEGKWHRFNRSYIEMLEKEIDKLELDYEEKYDFRYTKRTDLLKNEIKSYSYREEKFNKAREKDGFINRDKIITSLNRKYKIEYMDLYKDNTIYFVKCGSPQQLSYVIDQANTTLKILQTNNGKIEFQYETITIKSICLWLILTKKKKIKKLSKMRSLTFSMKLAGWKRNVQRAGFIPKIKINYVSATEKQKTNSQNQLF